MTVALALSATLGLALTASLWWAFFGTGDDDLAEESLTTAGPDGRPWLVLAAYFYAYIPMLLGIAATAAGLKNAIGHPGSTLSAGPAVALAGGVTLFLAGDVAFRHVLKIARPGTAPWPRRSPSRPGRFLSPSTPPLGSHCLQWWWQERWLWKGRLSALPLKHDRQVYAAGDGPGLV